MKYKAYGKVNLFLDVLSKRSDSYHELRMINAPILLHDILTFELLDEDIIKVETSIFVCEEQDNVVYKIIKKLKQQFNINKGIKVYIEKNIPTGAGLGGGSADGALTINVLNDLFSLGMSDQDKIEFALGFGTDIVFCLFNKVALVEGIGDKLTFLDMNFDFETLLVNPGVHCSTKEVYSNLNLINKQEKDYNEFLSRLQFNDFGLLEHKMYNFLEETTFLLYPLVKKVRTQIDILGFISLMSGSGSTIFVLDNDGQLEYLNSMCPDEYIKIKTNIVSSIK